MSIVSLSANEVLKMPEENQVDIFSTIDGSSSPEQIYLYGEWLSVRYASDGHVVAPNSTVLKRAKTDFPELPSTDPIKKVLGGISRLPEALGFVTEDTARAWTEEDYVLNGHWLSHNLGSATTPAMPRKKDLEWAARHKVGAPFEFIERLFGSVAAYQDALGFVTTTTLERWSDQDWVEYGTWLSHLLGSPEEPVMPAFADLAEASKCNIGPNPKNINGRFGSLSNYQAVLGFRDSPLEYKNWGSDDYIENGTWLSHLLGSPEEPVMPTSRDIDEAAAVGLCPPVSAIEKKFKRSVSRYQDALGFVTAATLERWSDQDWIDNGTWLGHLLLAKGVESPILNREVLAEAASYGLVPKRTQIVAKFGGILQYQQALGFSNPQNHRNWSQRDYLRYGLGIAHSISGRPSAKDITLSDGPSTFAIQNRFETIAKLNERLGLADYSHFSPSQLISFGVRWAHEHDGDILARGTLDALSKAKQGPGRSYVIGKFGDLETYRFEVEKSYKAFVQLREEHLIPYNASPAVIDFLLRDFQDTPEYKEEVARRINEISEMRNKYAIRFTGLCNIFHTSRVTALWDKDDFLYFREFLGKSTDEPKEGVEVLRVLDSYGLAPYLDEIEEVFCSLEDFITCS